MKLGIFLTCFLLLLTSEFLDVNAEFDRSVIMDFMNNLFPTLRIARRRISTTKVPKISSTISTLTKSPETPKSTLTTSTTKSPSKSTKAPETTTQSPSTTAKILQSTKTVENTSEKVSSTSYSTSSNETPSSTIIPGTTVRGSFNDIATSQLAGNIKASTEESLKSSSSTKSPSSVESSTQTYSSTSVPLTKTSTQQIDSESSSISRTTIIPNTTAVPLTTTTVKLGFLRTTTKKTITTAPYIETTSQAEVITTDSPSTEVNPATTTPSILIDSSTANPLANQPTSSEPTSADNSSSTDNPSDSIASNVQIQMLNSHNVANTDIEFIPNIDNVAENESPINNDSGTSLTNSDFSISSVQTSSSLHDNSILPSGQTHSDDEEMQIIDGNFDLSAQAASTLNQTAQCQYDSQGQIVNTVGDCFGACSTGFLIVFDVNLLAINCCCG